MTTVNPYCSSRAKGVTINVIFHWGTSKRFYEDCKGGIEYTLILFTKNAGQNIQGSKRLMKILLNHYIVLLSLSNILPS